MSPTNPSEKLQEAIDRLSKKVDDLAQQLPDRYIQRIEYEPWRLSMEQRVNTIETEMKTGRTEGMKAYLEILQKIQGAEERLNTKQEKIIEKIDASNVKSWEQRMSHIFTTFGWIVAIGLSILGYIIPLLQHLPH